MRNEYHVAVTGNDFAEGTLVHPFRTISKAAKVAERDTVIVHEGEYREWVKPEHSGTSNINRITYEAAEGEKVVIKGSERIQGWELFEGTVWKVIIPNTFFGEYNPYKEILSGDWLIPARDFRHPGEVYLNGVSFMKPIPLTKLKIQLYAQPYITCRILKPMN